MNKPNVEKLQDLGIKIDFNASGQVRTTCPKCSHNRKKKRQKCLAINVDEGVFKCHHCGWAGAVDKPSTPFKPKKRQSKRKNLTYNKKAVHKALEYIKFDLPDYFIKKFYKERKISQETLEFNRIGLVEASDSPINKTEIAIPFYENDQVVNIKFKSKENGQNRYRQTKGGKQIFYGLDMLDPNTDYIIITEGEIDKLSIDEVKDWRGTALSVPQGAPNVGDDTSNYFHFLDHASELLEGKEFIIATDNDPNGQYLKDELIKRLGRERCHIVEFPADCKDISDVLTKHGKDKIKDIIASADQLKIPGIITIEDIAEESFDLFKNGADKGQSTGWENLDEHYRVKKGLYTTITGSPGSGKSTFVDNLMINLIKNSGWKFLVSSFENIPAKYHLKKLVQKYTGQEVDKDKPGCISESEYKQTQEILKDHITFNYPDRWTPDKLLENARRMKYIQDIDAVIIDPFTELDLELPKGSNPTDRIGAILTQFRQICKKLNIHLFLVCHPTKMQSIKTHRLDNGILLKGHRPVRAYDISGSANFYNKGDAILSIYKVDGEPTTVFIQKIRFQEIGKTGFCQFKFDETSRTFKRFYDSYKHEDKAISEPQF
jgi:twinkle protein